MDSATYTAFLPVASPDFTADPPSVVRNIQGDGPIEDLSSTDIACNFNATPIADNGVSRLANVTAGSTMTLQWNGWPHSGPILTYMARCEPDCASFNGWEEASWFKIDERGYNATGKNWATYYLSKANFMWNVTIPECLADGEYLVRHEIIALSGCAVEGKCQFYPECTQVRVINGGDYTEEDLVSFPGAYSPTDPGILWDTNFQDPTTYTIPGPTVMACPDS
jgi:hypothetical protein